MLHSNHTTSPRSAQSTESSNVRCYALCNALHATIHPRPMASSLMLKDPKRTITITEFP